MVQMNKHRQENPPQYFIVDSTAIIHHFIFERKIDDNEVLIIPEMLKEEIISFQAKSNLALLSEERQIIFATPTESAVSSITNSAKESGDYSSLSKTDLNVIALSQDYPNSVVLSDDNAVQNVCNKLNVKFQSFQFKIKHQREYFWKCTVCGSKFKHKVDSCPDCGSTTKRYYKRK